MSEHFKNVEWFFLLPEEQEVGSTRLSNFLKWSMENHHWSIRRKRLWPETDKEWQKTSWGVSWELLTDDIFQICYSWNNMMLVSLYLTMAAFIHL